MYVRVKKIGSKRYAYLVEGASTNGRVTQKSLAYLGPITRIASGVSKDVREKVSLKLDKVDWARVNRAVRAVPLTVDELEELKRRQLPAAIGFRQRRGRVVGGGMPRAEGELRALAVLARKGFREMFEVVGDREYRMR